MVRAWIGSALLVTTGIFFAASAAAAEPTSPPRLAPEGEVLDDAGNFRPLSDFTRGRITLLGLINTRCAERPGCPRVTEAFRDVRALLRAESSLQSRVRLVSLSFDPVHDVPDVLASFGAQSRAGARGADWYFVTTLSARRLAPILAGFGAETPVADEAEPLPVYLLDPMGVVRAVYHAPRLSPRLIVDDIRALENEIAGKR